MPTEYLSASASKLNVNITITQQRNNATKFRAIARYEAKSNSNFKLEK